MTVLLAAVVGVLFGSGAFLMLKADLFRVVVGMVLISNAANVALMASGLSRGKPPIGASEEAETSDALVQAMTLTAIVIGFGVAVLLLALIYRVYLSHSTVDLDDLSQAEAGRERALERERLEV
ncbi:MAG: NADH-quinone oxidoreductase subunit K [Thermoleophilia bacterium]|nr:NADH-quinone oxidoreductase subunit K [Thermoleophilia bacterium]